MPESESKIGIRDREREREQDICVHVVLLSAEYHVLHMNVITNMYV